MNSEANYAQCNATITNVNFFYGTHTEMHADYACKNKLLKSFLE